AVSGPAWVILGARPVIVFVVNVVAPFGHVAVHIEQSPRIGFFLTDRVRLLGGVVDEPGKISELARVVAKRIVLIRPSAASVFPFCLSGQAVAVRLKITSSGVF